MTDTFSSYATGLEGPAVNHFVVSPSDAADLPFVTRALYVNASGTAVVRDAGGVDVTYAVEAGGVLPVRAVRVLAASTASLVAWY